ncbi:hypothetical protein VI06_21500 [Aquitalea magnusonii]|nr:hypothetical protein VI06_21500 [Aquitalea magnusonii]
MVGLWSAWLEPNGTISHTFTQIAINANEYPLMMVVQSYFLVLFLCLKMKTPYVKAGCRVRVSAKAAFQPMSEERLVYTEFQTGPILVLAENQKVLQGSVLPDLQNKRKLIPHAVCPLPPATPPSQRQLGHSGQSIM